MAIENIPEIYLQNKSATPNLYVYDFRMTQDVVKSKVHLTESYDQHGDVSEKMKIMSMKQGLVAW